MTGELRVGVVGLNGRVERVVLPGLALSSRGRLAAVCSRDPAKAASFARPYPGCRPFGSYDEMLGSDELDAVFILTPVELHAEMALAAIESGLLVCCEKPLAHDLASARAMAAAAAARSVRTAVNFTYRSATATRLMARELATGAIGRPIALDIAYLQDRGLRAEPRRRGDVMAELGCHVVDALLWWGAEAGAGDVDSVRALSGGGEPPIASVALAGLTDGALATLRVSRGASGRANAIVARLDGYGGALCLDFDTDRFTLTRHGPSGSIEVPTGDLWLSYADFPRFHFDRLLGALRGEEEFPDFTHGVAVQRVLDAIARSEASGSAVGLS